MEELEEKFSKKKPQNNYKFDDDEDFSSFATNHGKCIFSIEEIEDDFILLKDQSAKFGGKTITNAAEEVIKKIREFINKKKRKVYYIDSLDKKHQLLYNESFEFTGFKN